jgi:hypothetical protein
MNQEHGIEIGQLKKAKKLNGFIEVKESIIEDNFSDGIHLTYPRTLKPLPRPLK